MTDIATLIGRLLPFAVIASLVMIFYLLDVFSVRPAFDAETAKVAARQISMDTPRRADPPSSSQPSATFPAATANPAPPAKDGVPPPPQAMQPQAPGESTDGYDTASEMPPAGETPMTLPQPAAPVENQDTIESVAPRYIPPAGSAAQPLASDTNTLAPVELPDHEIPQDEGERIESEALQALDEAEQAASQAGAVEQEQ